MHPKNISINDFTYHLPEEKIAHFPLEERDSSRLLVYNKGVISEDTYSKIATHIPGESLLVFNNTKVIAARLLFQKATGGVIEIFLLEPHDQYGEIVTAMLQKERVSWKCLVGGASKWTHGLLLEKKIPILNQELTLHARYVEKKSDHFVIELAWSTSITFSELLHHAGAIPLPPYIKREVERTDAIRYQTIYAESEGSVAAPTAGLHFTQRIFTSLEEKNIHRTYVTLHVGAGTFRPVKTDTMEHHGMHAEYFDISREIIEKIKKSLCNKVVAVGTTSLRTIESLYWFGSGISRNKLVDTGSLELNQWEPYEYEGKNISAEAALDSLLIWMYQNKLEQLTGRTQILIAPGYKPRIVDGLITNFHQPNSTLLLLVAALIGDNWKKVYDYALQNDFRFLSYGDGSLLWFNRVKPFLGEAGL